MNVKVKGYAMGAVAAATYGLNPMFTLPLYRVGMDADSVLFWRYLIALPLLAAMILCRRRSFRLSRRQLSTTVVLGWLVALSSLTLFLSYNYMDAGVASTILFVYPVMVAVIMSLFFRERLTMLTALCIALATVGIGMLMKSGTGGAMLSLLGVTLVLGSALSYAVYIVAVNRSSLHDVPTLVITFYVLLFGVMLFILRIFLAGHVATPPAEQWWLWGCLVGLAVFPTAISFACTNTAIQCIGSTPTAILGALEPLTAVVIGVTMFGEALTPRICGGLILIVVAVSLVVGGNSVSAALVRVRRLFPKLHK